MTKPLPNHVDEDVQRALAELSRLLIGQLDLKDAQRALRKRMSQEALARCDGSRREAAALLGIDRRYVHRLASEGELCEPDRYGSAPITFSPWKP